MRGSPRGVVDHDHVPVQRAQEPLEQLWAVADGNHVADRLGVRRRDRLGEVALGQPARERAVLAHRAVLQAVERRGLRASVRTTFTNGSPP